MTVEESYAEGFFFGSALGDRLLQNSAATGGVEIELREEAQGAVARAYDEITRKEAAWRLGVVRGFRDEVRERRNHA